MKTILAGIILSVLLTAPLMAQDGPFGPKYKNQKPWEKETRISVVTTVEKPVLFGPEYKNKKAGQDKVEDVKVTTDRRKEKVFGPAYKNKKPWDR